MHEAAYGLTWHGDRGDRLELLIAGYRFPDCTEGYDANWLTVRARATSQDGSWEASSSCILTWELRWFARWLAHVVDGNMESASQCGLENDLELRFVATSSGSHRLAVCLRYGLSGQEAPDAVSVVYVLLDPAEHLDAVRYFRNAYFRFPPRGRQGEKARRLLPGPRTLAATKGM